MFATQIIYSSFDGCVTAFGATTGKNNLGWLQNSWDWNL